MEYIYSVEIEVHYEGITDYYLFSSPKKALDFAEGYMDQRERELDPDTVEDELERQYEATLAESDEELRVWRSRGEDVIIRRKSLMG